MAQMAVPNLATLQIERVIIHDVPRHLRRGPEPGPILSEVESSLTADLRLFFSERIKTTISGPNAFDVVSDPGSTSPVPDLISQLLNSRSGFVLHTQKIAQHLHTIQTGVNPGGLLAVMECQMQKGQVRTLAILKLEREEGVQLQQKKIEGKITFNLGHIRDLILTQKTKLFKIGLFEIDRSGKTYGTVCDQQRSYAPTTEVATFFLSDFLGCRLKMDPAVSTKHFFEKTEEFINNTVSDPLDRTSYHTHLLSEMTNKRTLINPREFASVCLNTEHRQLFLDHLAQGDTPVTPFQKDLSLFADRLKTTIMEFQSGIQIKGPRTAIDEKVSLKKHEGETIRATLTDKLKKIRNL